MLGTAVDSFPVADAQVVVGMFLLLFGLRWLHKAILRQAGLKALHDEAEEFEATKQALSTREHWVALTTAFNGVLLEGVEVVLIVIALGGVGHRAGAVVGASARAARGDRRGCGAARAADAHPGEPDEGDASA